MAAALSVNHYICPDGYAVERFLDDAVDVGARAVGLTVRALDEIGVTRLTTELADRALRVSSLNSVGYLTDGPGPDRDRQDALNRRLVDAAAALDADVLTAITGGLAEADMQRAVARSRIADGLRELDGIAGAAGVRLGLEPIHPVDIRTKGCVNAIGDALRLTESLPNTSLLVDLYHSWWDADLPTLFGRAIDRVALIQFCGIAEPDPDAKPTRVAPGDSGVVIADMLRAARAAGYDRVFEFELFAHHLAGREPAAVMRAAADWLARLDADSGDLTQG